MPPADHQFQTKGAPNSCPSKALTIAIDGPAGSGKSTVAREIARKLSYRYIDTGAMYRAATWLVLKENLNLADLEPIVKLIGKSSIEITFESEASGNMQILVNGQDVTAAIRSQEVTRLVSAISAIPGVRQYLVTKQQLLAEGGGIVMDGRDIGTVVLPQADLKIYLTASPEVRAQRRYQELKTGGIEVNFDELLQEIKDRDHRDSTRAVAPLRQAQDAISINTDGLTIEEVVAKILNLCKGQL